MAEVEKLRTFHDFCATLCGESRARFKNCGLFSMRARPSAEIRVVEVQKLRTFFAISAGRARPSAEIRVVEVQKLRTFYDFCRARAPLRRSRASKRSRCGAVQICLSLGETLCGDCACRSALAVAPCNILARETAFGSCLVVCAPAFAIPRSRVRFFALVRGSSGLKIAAFKYKRSTRSVLLARKS